MLRGIILKHGIPEFMKSSKNSSAKSNLKLGVMPKVKLPDWSAMTSRPIRLSFEQMLRHNEKLRLLFPRNRAKPGGGSRADA